MASSIDIIGAVTAVVAAATGLAQVISGPLKQKFNLIFHFKRNMRILRENVEAFDAAIAGMRMKVDAVRRNAKEILPHVEIWLKKADEISSEINTCLKDGPTAERHFMARFRLSKRATNLCGAIFKLIQEGSEMKDFSVPIPPPSRTSGSMPLKDMYAFESRKEVEEGIMESLRSRNHHIIGICGMGGVGKTYLVNRIMDKAREENLFSDIIFAVVGQGANALNIQLGIAQSMGMTLENMVLPNARANTLSTTLSKAQKKTLVILDDIWEDISLEDLGVSNKNVCQVILISRDSTILDGADEVYKLYTVYETEALDFFMKRVGKCIDDEALVNDVVSECNGLPLALAVVARTLKGNTHKDNWRGALRQLKTSNPVDIPKVLAEVYNSIKLSYDFLENEHARDIFLLCSLYPENYSIPVEDLVSYCVGLGTFEHLDELRETRERTSLVLTMLQHRSLLLECHYENYVAMHDIVRDVAIYIASKEGRVDCNIGTTSWLRENSSSN